MTARSLADQLQEIVDALRAQEGAGQALDSFQPHPDTVRLCQRRGVPKEQFSYATPEALNLRHRVHMYNLDHGNPGPGNVVAQLMDAALRAEGYPPPPTMDTED